jgi:hypothetical protein
MDNTNSENHAYFSKELECGEVLMKTKRANLTFTHQQTILHRITMPSSWFCMFQAGYYNGKALDELLQQLF